jgi:hypothetical protein
METSHIFWKDGLVAYGVKQEQKFENQTSRSEHFFRIGFPAFFDVGHVG